MAAAETLYHRVSRALELSSVDRATVGRRHSVTRVATLIHRALVSAAGHR